MSRVSISSIDKAARIAPPAGVVGDVTTSAVFDHDYNAIHLFAHRLGANAVLRFAGTPTDCLIYVWDGEVDAGGRRLPARSSAIVEYGASLEVTTSATPATVLEFRMRQRGADERAGGCVHLLPDERVPRIRTDQGKPVGMSLHADSQCPTCKVWLHENDYFGPDEETAVHSHSEDEVIFVRAGAVRLGRRLYGPGTALQIKANTLYGFSSGPEGLSFVNFRGTSPTYRSADGSVVLDEAELWRIHVGKPSYLEPC